MSVRFEWASAAHTNFNIVEHGYDTQTGEYLRGADLVELESGEVQFEGVVSQNVGVILSYDEAFVIEGSAVKIRALLRSIDQALEPLVQEEQANV